MTKHSKERGRGTAFIRANMAYDGDDCLIWPMFREEQGYGVLGFKGRIVRAHRLMCELVHGDPPGPDYEAAHSCGRGRDGCVNPRHLSWKTRSGNQLDRRRHNTHGRRTPIRFKLTAADVAEIRRLQGSDTTANIAAKFGVSRQNVQYILKRKSWVTGERRPGGFPKRANG